MDHLSLDRLIRKVSNHEKAYRNGNLKPDYSDYKKSSCQWSRSSLHGTDKFTDDYA